MWTRPFLSSSRHIRGHIWERHHEPTKHDRPSVAGWGVGNLEACWTAELFNSSCHAAPNRVFIVEMHIFQSRIAANINTATVFRIQSSLVYLLVTQTCHSTNNITKFPIGCLRLFNENKNSNLSSFLGPVSTASCQTWVERSCSLWLAK